MWGAGIGVLTFLALILAGWRLGQWFWYPVQLVFMAASFAFGAAALTAIYLAVFDPPPKRPAPDILLRESLR
jgi:hypothetical protein